PRLPPPIPPPGCGVLTPPPLFRLRFPLPPVHRVEDLLRLALGEPLALRFGGRLLALPASPTGLRRPAPSSARGRRRGLAACGQLEIPFGPRRRGLQHERL